MSCASLRSLRPVPSSEGARGREQAQGWQLGNLDFNCISGTAVGSQNLRAGLGCQVGVQEAGLGVLGEQIHTGRCIQDG